MPQTFELRVDASEIRDGLIPAFRDLPSLLHDVVLLRTVNRTGDMARTAVVKVLAKNVGVKQREVRGNVDVMRASREKLNYEIAVMSEWLSGLVNIITVGDEKVCPICQRAAERGPYTAEQIEEMHQPYRHLDGIVHVNCRCHLEPVEKDVKKMLQKRGSITREFLSTVKGNMPRIFAEEYSFAMRKLKIDHRLRG